MYPIDTSPDLIVSIQAAELSNYAIGLPYIGQNVAVEEYDYTVPDFGTYCPK